jgi:drug/metabolite transporter (DMT)-like permease
MSLFTFAAAALYVLSGVTQPLLVTLLRLAGLASARAQLYMLFYYLGPSLLVIFVGRNQKGHIPQSDRQSFFRVSSYGSIEKQHETVASSLQQPHSFLSSRHALRFGCVFAALFDVGAQAMNFTGAALAGPTLFAVIYSSVTVWASLFSRFFLGRQLAWIQWVAVATVFVGLSLAATNATTEDHHSGGNASAGVALVLVGSAAHAGTYVLSEALMKPPKPSLAMPSETVESGVVERQDSWCPSERLSVLENTTIQALTALVTMVLWQLFFTCRYWSVEVSQPMQEAGTTITYAVVLLAAFALSNLIHAYTFFHTLRHYPGGASSAAVFKGLQAVLVFVATHFLYCHHIGGEEMCFSGWKLASLVMVVGGVFVFTTNQNSDQHHTTSASRETD